MKRRIFLAIIVLAGAFTVNAQAQTAGAQIAVANIPFAFNVGNKNLPAGKYTISVLNSTSDRKVLQIRSNSGGSSAMIQTNSVIGNTSDDAKLVFERYGDRYFFARAQMAGEPTSFAALKTSAQRAQKEAVAARAKQSVVVIVAE
ncbi:MAG TPA: hypothetical protein VJM50_06035 [Pyrinomonadaceae bacterium]|nr:hypothetical protein [Pyrinomonadaceae bacterium]